MDNIVGSLPMVIHWNDPVTTEAKAEIVLKFNIIIRRPLYHEMRNLLDRFPVAF